MDTQNGRISAQTRQSTPFLQLHVPLIKVQN